MATLKGLVDKGNGLGEKARRGGVRLELGSCHELRPEEMR